MLMCDCDGPVIACINRCGLEQKMNLNLNLNESICILQIFDPRSQISSLLHLNPYQDGIITYIKLSQFTTAIALTRFPRRSRCTPSNLFAWILIFHVPRWSTPLSPTSTRTASSKI